jgi:hypothetical protein
MGALIPVPPPMVADATTTIALGVAPLLPPERATLLGRPSTTHGLTPLPLVTTRVRPWVATLLVVTTVAHPTCYTPQRCFGAVCGVSIYTISSPLPML